MLISEIPKYSYNDVVIKPCEISSISSRSECNPFLLDGYLPLFTAPMSTVVDLDNYDKFCENKIHAIIPRNIDFNDRYQACIKEHKWVAFSLNEFIENFTNENIKFSKAYVLIDVANGHMKKIFDAVKKAKIIHNDNLIVMIGNIANPRTYRYAFECRADYVRLSVGTGRGCITSSNVAIHYPIASLISETFDEKLKIFKMYNGISWDNMPKIIADGGVRGYSDIIKALALGADYVMVGSVFAKMLESSAPYIWKALYGYDFTSKEIDDFSIDKVERRNGKFYYLEREIEITKTYYGMASKSGQRDMGCDVTKTSEGLETSFKSEYTMNGWVNNFVDYLKSAMSYCDCRNVSDFVRRANVIPITTNTYNSINK